MSDKVLDSQTGLSESLQKRKIILIDHEPYTARRGRIFYLDTLMADGFEVEVWDLSSYFYPTLNLYKSEDSDYVYRLSSWPRIVDQLAGTDVLRTLFVVEVPNHWKHRKLFRLLKEKRCYTIRISLYEASNLPALPLLKRWKYWEARSIMRYMRIVGGSVLYKMYRYWYHIKPYDLCLTSREGFPDTRRINQTDYETYQKIKDCSPLISEPYVVFIDQYFPLHPDFAIYYYKKLTGEKQYQQCLNVFFQKIEQKYKVKVVIAAHPKSDYDLFTFQGRKIIKYRSPELIKYARFIIMHTSLAISFVFLFNKPVIFITTRQYNSYKGVRMLEEKIALLCRKKIFNIEKCSVDDLNITPVEEEARKKYIYTYLTSLQNENKNNEELLRDIFLSLS